MLGKHYHLSYSPSSPLVIYYAYKNLYVSFHFYHRMCDQ